MAIYEKDGQMRYAPTEENRLYPETDGKPMAASDDHKRVLIRILRALEVFFRSHPDVYVSGDLLMYYVQGDPRKVVSPDVLVSFGIGQKARRTYRVWEEGKPPDFVMELTSQSTYQKDLGEKLKIYAGLGIANYFLCEIEGVYLPTPLMGFTLRDGVYELIPQATDGGVPSSVLGLDLHLQHDTLQFYDPATGQWLQLPEAAAEAHAEAAEVRAAQETFARQQEAARAESAEAEAAALRAELARLRRNS